MTRRHAEFKTVTPTTFFGELFRLCNFQHRNFVCSITLIPFVIMSQNLVEIQSMTRRCAEIKVVTPPTFFAELFHFVIFRIEIVSAL